MGPVSSRADRPRGTSLVTALLALSIFVACDVSSTATTPFNGSWAGATTQFQVSLTLAQTAQAADSVRGSLSLTRIADSYQFASPLLTVLVHGDSVAFSFTPPAGSGYANVTFRGQRRGDRMDAAVAVDSSEAAVALQRL